MYTERLVNDIKFNVEQQVKEMYPDIALDFSVTGNNINILFNFSYVETTVTKDYGNNNQIGYQTVEDASFSVNVGNGGYSNQSAQSNGGKGLDFNDKWGETIGGAGILADVIENAAELADGPKVPNVITTGTKIATTALIIGGAANLYGSYQAKLKYDKSPKVWGDKARLAVSISATGISILGGGAGTLIGTGINLIDSFGGFEPFYFNMTVNQSQFYNTLNQK